MFWTGWYRRASGHFCELGFDRVDNLLGLGEAPFFEFGVNQISVERDLELPSRRGNERHARDLLLKLGQDFIRQTDGFGFVISNRAIDEFEFHRLQYLLR